MISDEVHPVTKCALAGQPDVMLHSRGQIRKTPNNYIQFSREELRNRR